MRASNLQEAAYFARRRNLHGVVMSSVPFVMSPMLMAYVKDAGLVSVSFGFLNNDAENAKVRNITHLCISVAFIPYSKAVSLTQIFLLDTIEQSRRNYYR